MTNRSGSFHYANPPRVYFGAGSRAALADALSGHETVQIVTTASLLGSTALGLLREVSPQIAAARVSTVSAHSPLEEVEAISAHIDHDGATAVVALGGGSAIDAAKLCAEDSGIVSFSLPTTLSAAELSGSGGFTDGGSGEKEGRSSPSMIPAAVFYDPDLSAETPARLWLSTGIRSLDHAIEALVVPSVDPITEVTATSAVADLLRLLPEYAADPSATEVRLDCLLAAWKSYLSPSTAAAGWSHGLGRAIGAKNNIPHGVTSCVILPKVVRHYSVRPETSAAIARLTAALGLPAGTGVDCSLAAMLEGLVGELGLPGSFSRAELDDDAVEAAAVIAAERTGAPIDQLRDILEDCRSAD